MSEFESHRFAIVIGAMKCHACSRSTRVSCLMLPGLPEGEEDERFYPQDRVRLQYVSTLNPEAMAAWQEHAPYIQWVESKTAGSRYLGNVCEWCGALQGDWFIGKPGAPFFPETQDGIDALHCKWFDLPIHAVADASQSSWMDNLPGALG